MFCYNYNTNRQAKTQTTTAYFSVAVKSNNESNRNSLFITTYNNQNMYFICISVQHECRKLIKL